MAGDRGGPPGRLVLGVLLSALLASCGVPPASSSPLASTPSPSPGDVLAEAQAVIAVQLAAHRAWPAPPAGPAAVGPRAIAYIGADMDNGGIAGVYDGVAEAAGVIGWTVVRYDGKASVEGRTLALEEALAGHPDGIILGGFDPEEQPTAMAEAQARHIPVVGWHAGPGSGPDGNGALFANVTTDPVEVAQLAADFVIASSGGHAGVAIFTDSQYQIAVEKADVIRARLQACGGCEVLAIEDTPIATAKEAMPPIVSSLLGRFGARLDYLVAINGNYFAGSAIALAKAGRSGAGAPYAVAAGDGDTSELARIRARQYQAASVAEPLPLQGWQLVDELNRAFAGRPPSGYVAPPALITLKNVPAGGVVDPQGYRAQFKAIWRP